MSWSFDDLTPRRSKGTLRVYARFANTSGNTLRKVKRVLLLKRRRPLMLASSQLAKLRRAIRRVGLMDPVWDRFRPPRHTKKTKY